MTVVDVHTHMLCDEWVRRIRKYGAPAYAVGKRPDGQEGLIEHGVPTMALQPALFDYPHRLRCMNEAGIDIAILSLTSPNVYWGSAAVSAESARVINDDMAAAQRAYPGRIRYLASLPWQYPELAVPELARACDTGAVGVMVLANIEGRHLTDPLFAPIWGEIDRRRLPVLVHPTAPIGAEKMDLDSVRLHPTVGFTFDTSLAVLRMVLEGFFDRYPNLKIIAAHGGGFLPFIVGRIDMFYRSNFPYQKKIAEPPSSYLKRIYYDAVVYQMDALQMCINLAGAERVLFGTDFPMPTDIPRILGQVNALPDSQAEKVRGGNAVRIFNLETS